MIKEWQDMEHLIEGKRIVIERIRLADDDIAIEGNFSLPLLAHLMADDQIFVAAFIRCHGSIKQMEKYFGVSYPTIKNRLNRISAELPFVEIEPAPEAAKDKLAILDRISSGELSVDEAINELHKGE
ncbi:MAG: DUF2089 domain-containing protein [Candidatus Zixiibacteriota bacterium]